jgi:hypothetical protein
MSGWFRFLYAWLSENGRISHKNSYWLASAGPQSFDRYLLGQNPPFDFETALETAVHFPLRFRLTLSEE